MNPSATIDEQGVRRAAFNTAMTSASNALARAHRIVFSATRRPVIEQHIFFERMAHLTRCSLPAV